MFFFQNALGRRNFLRIANCFTILGCSLALFKNTFLLIVGHCFIFYYYYLLGRLFNGLSIGFLTTLQSIYVVEYLPFEYRSLY